MEKKVTQTRVDQFPSSGSYVRVVGRTNHQISTDINITKSFDGKCYAFAHDAVYDRHGGESQYRSAHIPLSYETEGAAADGLRVPLNDLTVNKSIHQLAFRPLPSRHIVEGGQPETQLALLPYLCEDGVKNQAIYQVASNVVPMDTAADMDCLLYTSDAADE